ncbi:Unknown protein [Striga hermonthica]|uniref:Retrotransposon gag domain-containing protein n=1 Tax=Striga hermonthica TaxID=68872 RepID=A0A9N7NMU2_STRHE|nr:Unknown protein [Striga hermonthica]
MFQFSRVSEEEKVLCASFMLRGSAGHWWDTVKCIEDVHNLGPIERTFRSKYFTAPIRAMKMNEFIQLKQGNMIIADYIHKFEQLSRFAEHMVSTDYLKTERFLEGLKPELYRDVCMAGIQESNYSQVVERALIAEQAEQKIRKAQEIRRKRTKRIRNCLSFEGITWTHALQRQRPQWTRNEKKRPTQFQNQKPIFQQQR